ncbi:MAG TPA: PHP domain-containing protein [Anaerolineae bacterium]
MGKADLHIHTTYSDGLGTVRAMLEAASRTDLDVIAITDHDEIRGALEAADLASCYGIEVIPGTEITTRQGHLLALFVNQTFPRGRSLKETVLRVAERGGVCIAAHPTGQFIPSLTAADIADALADPDVARTLLGLEVYNAGLPFLRNNRNAQILGDRVGLAQLASSDSHLLWTIGLCATQYPGTSARCLRDALEQRLTVPVIHNRPFRFFTDWTRSKVLRFAGLAYNSMAPGEEWVLRRLSSVQP